MVSESITELREIHTEYSKRDSGLATGSAQNDNAMMHADEKGMSPRE